MPVLRTPPRWPSPTLARRIQWQIGAIIALVIVAVTWLSYRYTVEALREEAVGNLRASVQAKVTYESVDFGVAQSNTEALRDEYVRRLRARGDLDPRAEFDAWFSQEADGVIRVRPEHEDAKHVPSLYLRNDVPVGPELRRQVLVAFELLREWGPVLTQRYFSAYIDLPGNAIIVFSPTVNWGREAGPDIDTRQFPAAQNATPEKNPTRKSQWTDVYFDDKSLAWVTSIITPVDAGRWLGLASQDIAIDATIERINEQAAPGTYNMLLDAQGHLLAHPQWMVKIRRAGGKLQIPGLDDAVLSDVALHAWMADKTAMVVPSADGNLYYGLARIHGPDWIWVTVYPKALLEARGLAVARLILLVGLLGLALELSLLTWIIRRTVSAPLKTLSEATQALADGNLHVDLNVEGQAELAQLAGNFRHMTEKLREREDALQALNHALEGRVTKRTYDLEAANAELKDAMVTLQRTQNELVQGEKLASLGRMVAGVAHELNTPIGNALTIGSTLADHTRRMHRTMQAEQLKRSELADFLRDSAEACVVLERALRQAGHLIASFKQVAADQQSEQRRPFDLRTSLDEILAILRPGLRGTAIALESEVPAGIAMDSYPGLLAQVLSNLVTNAKVHAFDEPTAGQTGCRVVVQAQEQGDEVSLFICDNGRGIPEAIRSRIFDPFFTTRMGRGGTGLGLSIVHSIVTQGLGGSIRVDYTQAQGTCFVVTLPKCDPRPARNASLAH